MTNGVEFTLDKPRRIKFTLAELKALEQRLGKPMGDIVADMTRLSVNTMQQVLFAGLRATDNRLRFEDLERMLIDFVEGGKGTLNDVLYVLNEALMDSGYFGRAAGDKEAHD